MIILYSFLIGSFVFYTCNSLFRLNWDIYKKLSFSKSLLYKKAFIIKFIIYPKYYNRFAYYYLSKK